MLKLGVLHEGKLAEVVFLIQEFEYNFTGPDGKVGFTDVMDLANGYWQVAVMFEDREKTGFITHLGFSSRLSYHLACVMLLPRLSDSWN